MTIGDPVREHYTAVGVVAAEWSFFEVTIDRHSIHLAGVSHDIGACLTAQIAGVSRKIDAYMALAQLRGAKDVIGDLHVFAKDTTSLAERRNRIIHDPWIVGGIGPPLPKRLEITARRKLRRLLVDVPTSDVFECANHIQQHVHRLDALHERVIAEIFPRYSLP